MGRYNPAILNLTIFLIDFNERAYPLWTQRLKLNFAEITFPPPLYQGLFTLRSFGYLKKPQNVHEPISISWCLDAIVLETLVQSHHVLDPLFVVTNFKFKRTMLRTWIEKCQYKRDYLWKVISAMDTIVVRMYQSFFLEGSKWQQIEHANFCICGRR